MKARPAPNFGVKSMRKLILALALSGVSLGFSGMASAELNKADCRPLTQDNARACCTATNWNKLILSSDQDLCSKLGLNQLNPPLAATPPAALGTPPVDTNPPDDTNPPAQGINNGFGNGDQTAPGSSEPNNNAENDSGGRANPSSSPGSTP
jgi:hypothetical protein